MQNLCWLGESGTPCAAEAELKLWLAKPEKRRRDPSGDEKREQYKYGRTKALRATDQCCIEPAGLNSGISAAQNGASDWHCLAPHRHTSISLFLFFSSQFSDPPTHLTWHANVLSTNETGTYELTQSTTIFFHRFLVPTILTMHVFLGFFWRALCSSGKKQTCSHQILKKMYANVGHFEYQSAIQCLGHLVDAHIFLSVFFLMLLYQHIWLILNHKIQLLLKFFLIVYTFFTPRKNCSCL